MCILYLAHSTAHRLLMYNAIMGKLHLKRALLVLVIASSVTTMFLWSYDKSHEKVRDTSQREIQPQYISPRNVKQLYTTIRDMESHLPHEDNGNPTEKLNVTHHTQPHYDSLRHSQEHEESLRHLSRDINDLRLFMKSQKNKTNHLLSQDFLNTVTKNKSGDDAIAALRLAVEEARDALKDTFHRVGEYYQALMQDMWSEADSAGSEAWKMAENERLSELMQARLHTLQNPENCTTSRRLAVPVAEFGLGCTFHHLAYFLQLSYFTGRTMVIGESRWRYGGKEGWSQAFMPVSDTCTSLEGGAIVNWENHTDNDLIVRSPREFRVPMERLMSTLPREISEPLARFHGNPLLWLSAQFIKYLFRLQPHVRYYVTDMAQRLQFQHPIVGIQVRRTDKLIREAEYHDLDEYMTHVDDYYEVLTRRINQRTTNRTSNRTNNRTTNQSNDAIVRRVYIATDEPSIIGQARARYPNYEFITSENATVSAGLDTRYTITSLHGIILDLSLLAQSDHIVCDLASQMCQMAYELMQTHHGDATDSVDSVDGQYHILQASHIRVFVTWMEHVARHRGEIDLQVGDVIFKSHNRNNGYSRGRNERTGQRGLYPTFKVRPTIKMMDFAYPGTF